MGEGVIAWINVTDADGVLIDRIAVDRELIDATFDLGRDLTEVVPIEQIADALFVAGDMLREQQIADALRRALPDTERRG